MVLKCGVSKLPIIPEPYNKFGDLFIAGYASMGAPLINGIHDSLFARAMVISDDFTKIVFVSVECIGLLAEFIEEIKNDLSAHGFNKGNVFIFATHTHAGPDTMGMWGPYLGRSGINPKYMLFLRDKIIETVLEAEKKSEKVEIFHTQGSLNSLIVNYRVKGTVNSTIHILKFCNEKRVISTLWTFSAQPEMTTRENVEISADYPGIVSKMIEDEFGGIALFGLGLCGAQSPIYCEQGFEKIYEFSNKIFEKIKQIYQDAILIPSNNIEIRKRKISLPLKNGEFELLFTLGIFKRERKDGNISSTLSKIRIGGLHLLMIPGEIFPALIKPLLDQVNDETYITLSLVNDSLGYFIPLEEFSLKTQQFQNPEKEENFIGHELESLGYEAAEIIRKTIKEIMIYHKVLAFGPHADDLTLFAGGLLKKLSSEGNELICVRITDDFDDCLGLSPEKARKRNRKEAEKAYKVLGAKETIHMGYPSETLSSTDYREFRGKIVYLIRKYKPDIVVGFDLNGIDEENADHIFAARAMNEACWQASFDSLYTEQFEEGLKIHTVAERFLYARNPTVVNYQLDISDFIEDKIKAICEHKTVLKNFFHQYRLSTRANRLKVELLEAPIPEPILVNLLARVNFAEIGEKFNAAYGEEFNHIDAGFLKEFAE
ncbi:MAG: neutral/alkaline non-lysosomal ceramidase N-terminal domain-containing protein [Promethearchaeota archaeon]